MKTIVKRFIAISMCLVTLIGVGAAVLSRCFPIPQSPPLQDQRGIVLNQEQETRLIEMIFDAARQNDVTTIDEYLSSGFSPNVRSPRGDTLLTVAAYRDSIGVVERLLKEPEIDIEARNRMGLTAVAAAAFNGHERPLRALIAAGADVNSSNSMNQTALMYASLSGRTNAVQLLLAAGADQNQSDTEGNSALSVAQTQGANEVVSILTRQAKTGSQ